MNLKLLLCSVLLLLTVFGSALAESLDETVIKKIDLKSDVASLDQISGSIEPTDSKLNVSDQSLKNISDKLSSKEDELNLKKVAERDAKGDDKKEINPPSKLFLTKDELIGSNQNGKDKSKHKDKAQTKDAKQEQLDDAAAAAAEKADDLPSFDEWKKKVVEEEPNNQQSSTTINASNKGRFQNPGKGNKLRIRNYASSECGAKVINSNKEAQGSYKILSESQDEYMLNPCNSKIWFIIELCEAIKLSSIEVANYELFSSTFRNFLIYGSGHYPTRDWQLVGNFTANDVKQVQEFSFSGEVEFRKFIKIEILSHHGSEHFCPFSLVRAFGTSMTDEFDEIENKIPIPIDEHEMLLETNKTNESRPEKNYLNEKSMFYKILRKVAAFFYKTLPERDRKDKTKEENFASFLRDRDTLDAIIEQSIMTMMSTLEPKLSLCLNLDQQSKKRRNRRIRFCNYLRTLIGTTTFDLLIKEMQKEHDQQFKCLFGANSSDPLSLELRPQNNSTSEQGSLNLESSMTDQTANSVKPDEKQSSISNSDFLSISDSIKITSSNSQSTVLLPTPTIAVRKEEQPDELSTISNSQDQPNESADESAGKEEKSIQLEDSASSSPADDRPLNSEAISKPTATSLVEEGATATVAAPGQQSIKPTEKTSTPLENTPIASSKTMHPDDELPNGTPLSGSSSKESIFIRMMNKIKTLELNLSLSSQYLEELSQRYRRQMDEMQKNFNQTIFKLNETSKSAAEKDNRQQMLLDKLGSKISDLEEKLFILIAIIIAKVIFDLVSWYRR